MKRTASVFLNPRGIARRWFPIIGTLASAFFQSLEICAVETNKLPAVLSPYLQNPAADGMTVCFPAQGAENVRVAWSIDGQLAMSEVPATGVAIAGTPWTVWKIRLAKLQPGAAYQYQVRYHLPTGDASAPVHHFRTLNPQAKTLRLAAFNDLHNHDGTLVALMKYVKPDDYEFSLLMGDCWANPSAEKEASGVFRTLDAFVGLLDAADKPMILVRGNHETRGDFSGPLADLFDLPNLDATQKPDDRQWQFTLRAGPVFFIAMDTGEDDGFETATDSYKRPKFWQDYRQREAAWLKNLAAAKPWGDTAWRIFVSHIPLFNNNWDFSEPARKYWEPLLPAANIDLMIAGHDHGWKLLPKGNSYDIKRKKNGAEETRTITTPWPVLIGGGPAVNQATVMLLTADEKTLRARLLAAADGRLLTEFVTDKAGTK